MTRAPHLVLAGCGHAHLFVLEALARGEFPLARVTLISPAEEYFYSGMESGVTAGQYEPEQARFRPPLLARAGGAEWGCTAVTRVDADGRRVVLSTGAEIAYDLLSLNIGARLQGDDPPGDSSPDPSDALLPGAGRSSHGAYPAAAFDPAPLTLNLTST